MTGRESQQLSQHLSRHLPRRPPNPLVVYDHQAFTLQRVGGVSRYACELASRVAGSDDFRALVVAPLHINDHLAEAAVPVRGLHVPLRHTRPQRLAAWISQTLTPLASLGLRPALLHRTYYAHTRMPASAAASVAASLPTVVTVHDMIHERYAGEFPRDDTTSRDKRARVESADLVICVSRHTADDLVRLLDVPPARIRVVPQGVSAVFMSDQSAHPNPSLRADASQHRAQHPGQRPVHHPVHSEGPGQRPYLLHVGQRGGYKNFAGALRAYAQSPRLRTEFDLVVFGGLPLLPAEQALARSLGLRPEAVRRVEGSDAALARAYRQARALVYPSRYEGFGLPPLEAMACGCPVACANTSALPEVVGEAAELFNPDDVPAMAQALERVCFDEARRSVLVRAGAERARQFSWDRCARETMQAYRDLLGRA